MHVLCATVVPVLAQPKHTSGSMQSLGQRVSAQLLAISKKSKPDDIAHLTSWPLCLQLRQTPQPCLVIRDHMGHRSTAQQGLTFTILLATSGHVTVFS